MISYNTTALRIWSDPLDFGVEYFVLWFFLIGNSEEFIKSITLDWGFRMWMQFLHFFLQLLSYFLIWYPFLKIEYGFACFFLLFF